MTWRETIKRFVTVSAARGVLLLGGPTASGKTALAIRLAERYGAEIVGADSRQVYRDMPVGTAAPTDAQRAQVAHHLVGWIDPYERYSAARYVADAAAAIAAIHACGRRAIVAGGTGFYLRALCGDVDLAVEPDPGLRERMLREAETHPPEVLHAWLRTRDPRRAAAISAGDRYRVVRALEIEGGRRAGGATVRQALPTLRACGLAFVKLALRVEPQLLARRIAERIDAMLANGLIEEAERIGERAAAADAVGYREALAYARGWSTHAELRAALIRATRRYAKRQLTWFGSEPDVIWVEADEIGAVDAAAARLGWTPHEGKMLPRRRDAPHRA